MQGRRERIPQNLVGADSISALKATGKKEETEKEEKKEERRKGETKKKEGQTKKNSHPGRDPGSL